MTVVRSLCCVIDHETVRLTVWYTVSTEEGKGLWSSSVAIQGGATNRR